jgi:hypothetical protein
MSTIAVSVAALVLSVTSFIVMLVLTLRRDISAIRPVLVFTYRSEGWYLENVGAGPALDVAFHRILGDRVTQSVRLPALAKGAEFCLHFARHDSKQIFVATYRDVDGRPYSSRSRHDLSTSAKGFQVERPRTRKGLLVGGSCRTAMSRRPNNIALEPTAPNRLRYD